MPEAKLSLQESVARQRAELKQTIEAPLHLAAETCRDAWGDRARLNDALARVFRLLGHRVITDNHLGDWGTQFGKLLVGWKRHLDTAALERDAVAEMERLYKHVHEASERDPAVLEAARQELVKLQGGDPENLGIWRRMLALSQHQFDRIYQRLGVRFDHTLGESFYNPHLAGV
ncbi:partial Arginine--tRNA ligase, partial [Rhodocyclaceae bacterium]